MQTKLKKLLLEIVSALKNKELLGHFRAYKKVQQVHKRTDGFQRTDRYKLVFLRGDLNQILLNFYLTFKHKKKKKILKEYLLSFTFLEIFLGNFLLIKGNCQIFDFA